MAKNKVEQAVEEQPVEEVVEEVRPVRFKHTLVFRACDIVDELSRRDQVWETNGRSKAINEVLLIGPRLGVEWTIIKESEDEEAGTYTIIAETDADEVLIDQKYAGYKTARGMSEDDGVAETDAE